MPGVGRFTRSVVGGSDSPCETRILRVLLRLRTAARPAPGLTYTKGVRYSAEVLSYQQVETLDSVIFESSVLLASTRSVSGFLLANVGRATEHGVD